MVSVKEWLLPMAARSWLAEEQREEIASPIKEGPPLCGFFLLKGVFFPAFVRERLVFLKKGQAGF